MSNWNTPRVNRRSMFKAGGVGAAALGAASLTACGGDGGSGDKISWRLAEAHPDDYPTTLGDKKFADLVRERSDGRIDIKVFANSQLGEETDAIEQVQMGAIEMTRVSSAPMTEFASGMGLFGLPFIWEDGEHLWRFLDDDAGKSLLGELDESGFKGLAYFDPGARSFYTSEKEIKTLADVEGQKFRVQESEVIIDFIKALGGSPTPMDYGEVYSALQSGVIDGAENNEPSYYSASHYEVAPFFIKDEHMRIAELLVVNKDKWDGLSQEDQDLLQQAADDAVPYQKEKWAAQVTKDTAALEKAGVTLNEVTDIDDWRAAVQPVIDKYGEEFADNLARVEELRNA